MNKTSPRTGRRDRRASPGRAAKPEKAAVDDSLENLLEYLKRTRGFDFTAYKRSSLSRRILKRMQDVGIKSYADYTDYLEVHPEEFSQLFNTILINVTDFFRDPAIWELIRDQVIPRILESKSPDQPIRVWVAGCASGEESFTVAMLFAEALGVNQFRERVKIYGTDVDEESLNQARLAGYQQKQVAAVPPELVAKYFEPVNGRFFFNKDLRRAIIFGRHDLIQDAPISRVDLITCRNTLMYFNAEAQSRIIARFGFALNDGGFLLLGKAETLLAPLNLFAPVDVKRRVFTKLPRSTPRDRLVLAAQGVNDVYGPRLDDARLREAALDADPLAQILIDTNGVLIFVNEAARFLFGLNYNDIGRPIQDLEISYRPVELRSLIEETYASRRPVVVHDVEYPSGGGPGSRYFDLTIIPLFDGSGGGIGVKAVFTDITRYRRLQEELQQSHQELETAYEELQSANEELETTNEELQSTVEELETTNEELQSTNEELETMNEELQSTNEELETTNAQLRERSSELSQANSFNQYILARMLEGLIVVDRDLRITGWNRRAEDQWGLRSEEVIGKYLLNLDSGLPTQELRNPIRAILSGEQETQVLNLEALNRRGRTVHIAVHITPLTRPGEEAEGAIILIEEKRDEAHEAK